MCGAAAAGGEKRRSRRKTERGRASETAGRARKNDKKTPGPGRENLADGRTDGRASARTRTWTDHDGRTPARRRNCVTGSHERTGSRHRRAGRPTHGAGHGRRRLAATAGVMTRRPRRGGDWFSCPSPLLPPIRPVVRRVVAVSRDNIKIVSRRVVARPSIVTCRVDEICILFFFFFILLNARAQNPRRGSRPPTYLYVRF